MSFDAQTLGPIMTSGAIGTPGVIGRFILSPSGDGDPVFSVPMELMGSDESVRTLSGKRILLLEDEVFIGLDLRHEAEDAGASVAYARTLRDALTLVREEIFDGAILDVTLGGGETCKPVADILRRVGTPFILHSGDLDRQGEVIDTLDAPVVAKPAPPEVVVGRLARLLSASKVS